MEYVIAQSSSSRLRQYATLPACFSPVLYRFLTDVRFRRHFGESSDMYGAQMSKSEVNQGVRAQRRLHRLRYS